MRFFLCDGIVSTDGTRRLTGIKAFGLMDGYLDQHYPRRPELPASLLVEGLAQLGGLLNLLNKAFAVEMVLMLVDGVRLTGRPAPGESISMEVAMLREHSYGATMSGTASAQGCPVATVDRLVFAHEIVDDPVVLARNRRRFHYQAGPLSNGDGS